MTESLFQWACVPVLCLYNRYPQLRWMRQDSCLGLELEKYSSPRLDKAQVKSFFLESKPLFQRMLVKFHIAYFLLSLMDPGKTSLLFTLRTSLLRFLEVKPTNCWYFPKSLAAKNFPLSSKSLLSFQGFFTIAI